MALKGDFDSLFGVVLAWAHNVILKNVHYYSTNIQHFNAIQHKQYSVCKTGRKCNVCQPSCGTAWWTALPGYKCSATSAPSARK